MKVFFSGGPKDGQYEDMERTPSEWHVPVRPPRPSFSCAEYFADANLPRRSERVKVAVYKLGASPNGRPVYWYEGTL